MYLNIAEATVNGATGHDAPAALKALAESRGAAVPTVTSDGVFSERHKELAWEGHLWFDLARTGRAMTRTDFVGDPSAKEVQPGDIRWAMPIPFREFGVNPNLVQNEGY